MPSQLRSKYLRPAVPRLTVPNVPTPEVRPARRATVEQRLPTPRWHIVKKAAGLLRLKQRRIAGIPVYVSWASLLLALLIGIVIGWLR